jgi:hypothetical protein
VRFEHQFTYPLSVTFTQRFGGRDSAHVLGYDVPATTQDSLGKFVQVG